MKKENKEKIEILVAGFGIGLGIGALMLYVLQILI